MENKDESPVTDYYSARSRSVSLESHCSNLAADLAPLSDKGKREFIGVSSNEKREFKDKRIYLNPRTGLPVRPPSSFALFKHTMRRNIKDGKVNFFEFNKKATEQWTKMSDELKEPFIQRAKMLADQFKKVEVFYLRKRVRELQQEVKYNRRSDSGENSGDY